MSLYLDDFQHKEWTNQVASLHYHRWSIWRTDRSNNTSSRLSRKIWKDWFWKIDFFKFIKCTGIKFVQDNYYRARQFTLRELILARSNFRVRKKKNRKKSHFAGINFRDFALFGLISFIFLGIFQIFWWKIAKIVFRGL